MNHKITLFIGLLTLIASVYSVQLPKIDDQEAYRAGLSAGEMLLGQWITIAKKDREASMRLSQEFNSRQKKYMKETNKSFLLGTLDALKKKDVRAVAQSHKLDQAATVYVLSCYYFLNELVARALSTGEYDDLDEDKELEILKKAAREVYGKDSPELLDDLKNAFADYQAIDEDVVRTQLAGFFEQDELSIEPDFDAPDAD